jgi:hypothetical protein
MTAMLGIMNRRGVKAALFLALALSGCAARNAYPGAKSEDIKFCRLEARLVAPIKAGSTYNDCMESLGYGDS